MSRTIMPDGYDMTVPMLPFLRCYMTRRRYARTRCSRAVIMLIMSRFCHAYRHQHDAWRMRVLPVTRSSVMPLRLRRRSNSSPRSQCVGRARRLPVVISSILLKQMSYRAAAYRCGTSSRGGSAFGRSSRLHFASTRPPTSHVTAVEALIHIAR